MLSNNFLSECAGDLSDHIRGRELVPDRSAPGALPVRHAVACLRHGGDPGADHRQHRGRRPLRRGES